MNPTVSIDYSKFTANLRRHRAMSKKSDLEFVRFMAKRCLKYLVRLTPPTGNAPFREDMTAQRRAGEQAIHNDIKKLFLPTSEVKAIQDPRTETGRKLAKLVRQNKFVQADQLIRGARLPFMGALQRADPWIHSQHRNRRGRVARVKPGPYMVKSMPSIKALQRKLWSRVGMAKRGWMEAAKALKFRLPRWVSRHKWPMGEYREEPSAFGIKVHLINNTPYANRFDTNIVPRALRELEKSLSLQLKKFAEMRAKGDPRAPQEPDTP